MFEFTETERAYLKDMRSISTDDKGREVLVGLTYEETESYMAHRRKFSSGIRDHINKAIYLELHEKHEKVRLEIIGTEHMVRIRRESVH